MHSTNRKITKKVLAILTLSLIVLSACGPKNLYKVDSNFKFDTRLNRDILVQSLDLGTEFLLNNQTELGNFNYEYNFVDQSFTDGDNEVRQAGALWGMSLLHHNQINPELKTSIEKGLAFFHENSIYLEDKNQRYIAYPDGNELGKTGTMALVCLALIDYLRAEGDFEEKEQYEEQLTQYMNFLLSLYEDGFFWGTYELDANGEAYDAPSPYSDGEALLAMIKTHNYIDIDGLKIDPEIIQEAANEMYDEYVIDALNDDPDSDTTKGFYQWSSMSFHELYISDLSDEKYAKWTIDLANWMIDVHETLERTRNTGYAYEGIISAYELARLSKDQKHVDKFAQIIDEGLYKLSSWQVGSPIQNDYLIEQTQLKPSILEDSLAVGGIMNRASEEPYLRIDVGQHQMHAVILALRYLYR